MRNRLQALGDALALKQQRRRIEQIVGALETGVPGIAAEASATGVTISGARLARRWLSDPALRFAATMSR